jgi:para-aminobenzoate synthetase/4-amino-4-deoxychorismate lyase
VSSARRRPDRQRGVLETLLVIDGETIELEAHLGRLGASLAALFPGRTPPMSLAGEVESAAAEIARGGLRVTVAPGADDRLAVAIDPVEIDPRQILPPDPPAVEARAVVVRGGLGGHKWADRALLDGARAGSGADPVPLIFDWDGTLLEASRANAFAAFGRTLVTPPADGRILPGIARARALEVAAEAGFEVREATLLREDLAGADEVFLTGSLRGVERVRALDGAALGCAGSASSLIHAALRSAWAGAGLDRVARR